MRTLFERYVKDESGATVIEYALIAMMVSVAAIAGMTTLGSQLGVTFTGITTELQ